MDKKTIITLLIIGLSCVNLLLLFTKIDDGEVAERFKATVLKTVAHESGPWVRIPPSPHYEKDGMRSLHPKGVNPTLSAREALPAKLQS